MTRFGEFSAGEGSELLGQKAHCSAAKGGSETNANGGEGDSDFASGDACGPLGQEGGFAASCFGNDEGDVVYWMNEPIVEGLQFALASAEGSVVRDAEVFVQEADERSVAGFRELDVCL